MVLMSVFDVAISDMINYSTHIHKYIGVVNFACCITYVIEEIIKVELYIVLKHEVPHPL